jgi:hypothetical protein
MTFDSRKLLLATLLAALLPLAALAQDAADGQAEEAPQQDSTVLDAPETEVKAEDLPEFDQAEIIRGQLARLEPIKQKLQLVMLASESEHFMLFSDLDSRVRRAILTWLEGLRTKLIDELGLDAESRLWDGKCLVLVFAKQEYLARYAREFDNHDVKRPRGYFVLEARRVRGPRLVHIAAYQPVTGGNEALQEVLVHETTHAITELYKKSVAIPLWLHEGLAEYMTLLMNPTLRPAKQKIAYAVAAASPYQSVQGVLTQPFTSRNMAAYAVSMSMVDYLASVDSDGVIRVLELMKEGQEAEAALGKVYPGLDYQELERRWQRYVLRNYRPPKR